MNALTSLRDTALRRRNAAADEDYEERTLLGQALDTALLPVRIATSRPAIKAYLTTLLFFFTSFVLISISTTAYFLFYYNYIPQIGLTQTIYLQYDATSHPHATVMIDTSALISQQPYDISVTLHMPRTPSNMAAGNFMVELALLPDLATSSGPLAYLFNSTSGPSSTTPLAQARRPAILPYASHVTSLSHKLLNLPIHLLSLKDLDASVLKVPMFERLSFARGRTNIPKAAYIELQSQTLPTGCPPPQQPVIGLHVLSSPTRTSVTTMQVYSAQIHFSARFEGLRYYVYNYRTISFLIFSSIFYSFALTSTAIAWAFITAMISARNPKATLPNARGDSTRRIKAEDSTTSDGRSPQIKDEEGSGLRISEIKAEDDSDLEPQLDSRSLANLSGTERTFPTLGRNSQPLRYRADTTTIPPSDDAETSWTVQRDDGTHDAEDEDEDNNNTTRGRIITPVSADALVKDEDEASDDGFRGDSGIGTSMESEARSSGTAGLVRRRSSRGSGTGRR